MEAEISRQGPSISFRNCKCKKNILSARSNFHQQIARTVPKKKFQQEFFENVDKFIPPGINALVLI